MNKQQLLKQQQERLEYLRNEIIHERISYGELSELYTLADFIDASDNLLREWSGIPENG